MPIYEYKCTTCGHQLEAIQKFSDEPLTDCPECHKPNLQKLVSSSAFHLKGSGWYVTDIRDKDKKKPEAAKDAPASDAPAAAAPTTEKPSGGSFTNSTDSSSGST